MTLTKQAYHLHQINCLVQLNAQKLSLICGSFLCPHGGSFLPWLSCLRLLKTMQELPGRVTLVSEFLKAVINGQEIEPSSTNVLDSIQDQGIDGLMPSPR